MNCQRCNSFFVPKDKSRPAKFCSRSCAALASNKGNVEQWIDCACCMAKAGIGLRNSAKLIGIAKFGAISSALKHRGVKRQGSEEGWRKLAQKQGFNQNTGKVRWWGGDDAERLWLSQQKARFHDWSYIWYLEKAKRDQKDRYKNMTEEEKKKHNKRCMAYRTRLWEENPEEKKKARARIEKWKKQNPEKNRKSIRSSIKRRKENDPGFRVQVNMRNRFKEIMSVVRDHSKRWNSSLIGCDTRQLAAHLESQFTRGMSWSNYGTHWHVDHIIPCSAFDHTKLEQIRQCWHWTNLRPLGAKENLAKSNRITKPQMSLLF